MTDNELQNIARQICEIREQNIEEGGAPVGGASIFDSPSDLVSWARRTARFLGDPAWAAEDVLQEVLLRLLQDRNVPLTAKPSWVYDAARRNVFVHAENWPDTGYRDNIPDIEADLRILLHWMEWQAIQLSIEGGMSQKQVAKELDCSDRQVRSLVQRARMKIKAYLGVGYVSE